MPQSSAYISPYLMAGSNWKQVMVNGWASIIIAIAIQVDDSISPIGDSVISVRDTHTHNTHSRESK